MVRTQRLSRRGSATLAKPAPALSWDLRDFPAGFVRSDYPFGVNRPTAGSTFQMFISFAVLLPESFRGGCSFGLRPSGFGRRVGLKRRGIRLPRGIECMAMAARHPAGCRVAVHHK